MVYYSTLSPLDLTCTYSMVLEYLPTYTSRRGSLCIRDDQKRISCAEEVLAGKRDGSEVCSIGREGL